MEFRPCIDIHNGKVKQIVGGTLKDQNDQAAENFVSEQDAPFYAQLYKTYGISGGQILLIMKRQNCRLWRHCRCIPADCRWAAVLQQRMPMSF